MRLASSSGETTADRGRGATSWTRCQINLVIADFASLLDQTLGLEALLRRPVLSILLVILGERLVVLAHR